jgi:Zn-dependent metalloprotease
MPISVDGGGVHVNSFITNHTAYLIGQEIGRGKLGQIYYRALTVYLTPNSDFSDARQAIVQSAIDLYGKGS